MTKSTGFRHYYRILSAPIPIIFVNNIFVHKSKKGRTGNGPGSPPFGLTVKRNFAFRFDFPGHLIIYPNVCKIGPSHVQERNNRIQHTFILFVGQLLAQMNDYNIVVPFQQFVRNEEFRHYFALMALITCSNKSSGTFVKETFDLVSVSIFPLISCI